MASKKPSEVGRPRIAGGPRGRRPVTRESQGPSMDKALFNYNVNQTRMSPQSRAMAAEFLLEGRSQTAIARRYGVTQGRVAQIVQAVREPRVAGGGTARAPRGWVMVMVGKVPVHTAHAIMEMARLARLEHTGAVVEALEEERGYAETYQGDRIVSPDEW